MNAIPQLTVFDAKTGTVVGTIDLAAAQNSPSPMAKHRLRQHQDKAELVASIPARYKIKSAGPSLPAGTPQPSPSTSSITASSAPAANPQS